jgi:hypothetical protein
MPILQAVKLAMVATLVFLTAATIHHLFNGDAGGLVGNSRI